MATKRQFPALGEIPSDLPGIRNWLLRLKEITERREGTRGVSNESFVTWGDLQDGGIASKGSVNRVVLTQTATTTTTDTAATTAPTATSAEISALIEQINELELALGKSKSSTDTALHDFSMNLSASIEEQLAVIQKTIPPRSADYYLDLISGQIREEQLYQDLGDRINLIDTPETGLVARSAALEAAMTAANAQIADLNQTPLYDNATTYAIDDIVRYDGALYQAIAATTGNLPTNTTYWTKIGDYATLGEAVAGIAVQLTDVDARVLVTEGNITSITSDLTTLASTVNDPTTGLAATRSTLTTGYSTTADMNTAISDAISELSSVTNLQSKTFYQTDAPDKRGGTTEAPIPLQLGDVWIDTNDSNKTYIWNGTAWAYTVDGTVTGSVTTLSSNLTNNYYTKTAVDSAISQSSTTLRSYANLNTRTFAQTEPPTNRGPDPANPSVNVPLVVGDEWVDINDKNKPYYWTGSAWSSSRDGTIADVDSRVNTVETTKIGYCTISGVASDHVDKGTCEAASGVWHVGLPMATAVKQVAVSDGTSSVVLEQRFTAQKTLNGTLSAQYSVKVDNNGYVSGFGLSSDPVNGTPYSSFLFRADKFAIASPEGPGVTPSFPFTVYTTATTVNGVTIQPGVYMKSANIETITADKITTGTLSASTAIIAGSASTGVIIDGSSAKIRTTAQGEWTTYAFLWGVTTTPSLPSSGTANPPSGWSAAPPTSYSGNLYRAKGTVSSAGNIVWDTVQKVGPSVAGTSRYQWAKNTLAQNQVSYIYAPTTGWQDTPLSISGEEKLWNRYVSASGTVLSPSLYTKRVAGNTSASGIRDMVTMGNLSDGHYGILSVDSTGATAFRIDDAGLVLTPTTASLNALGIASNYRVAADGNVTITNTGATTASKTVYIPLAWNGAESGAYMINVAGKFSRWNKSTGAFTSRYGNSAVLHAAYAWNASGSYTLRTVVRLADTDDGTNFLASTNISVIYDSTGATAGGIGLYLKLIGPSMYPLSHATYDDEVKFTYAAWVLETA